jgi:hypothetical protein
MKQMTKMTNCLTAGRSEDELLRMLAAAETEIAALTDMLRAASVRADHVRLAIEARRHGPRLVTR